MHSFARLYEALDRTTSTNAKVEAMAAYFRAADPADGAWAVHFLIGRKIKRLVNASLLWQWAGEEAGIQEWLFGESYSVVGDLAETVALLLGKPRTDDATSAPAGPGAGPAADGDVPLASWITHRVQRLRALTPEQQKRIVTEWYRTLPRDELFIVVKLLTGELRVGVSQTLVARAIAQAFGLEPAVASQRLLGDWEPSAQFFEALRSPGDAGLSLMRAQPKQGLLFDAGTSNITPYPFYLASPIDAPVDQLGPRDQWLVEWKWDGIRAQLIKRGPLPALWSRGDELITERFPEIIDAGASLPDGVVIDGEIVVLLDGKVAPFQLLQRRIGRQKLGPKVLGEAPAAFLAYDLLEHAGADIRSSPLEKRRAGLEEILAGRSGRLLLSEVLNAPTWDEVGGLRATSREKRVEGVMIKRLSSPYGVGRVRGDWWKWKIDPYTLDAVLVYAQPGHGKRANLLTDYTFALWDKGELVPVAKAYSGLTNEEIATLDSWIRSHTVERFGPVRSVEPRHVFELAFERIALSDRHRSGVALRFPRISRWRTDKTPQEADSLQRAREILALQH